MKPIIADLIRAVGEADQRRITYRQILRDHLADLYSSHTAITHAFPLTNAVIEGYRRLGEIEFDYLADGSAFRVSRTQRTFTLNAESVDRMVLTSFKTVPAMSTPQNFNVALVYSTLLLGDHEAVHGSDNLIEYSDVQRLKGACGRQTLARHDTKADIIATTSVAASEIFRESHRLSKFAERFFELLFFNASVCFPAFDFSASAEKLNRALSILLSMVEASTWIETANPRIDVIFAPDFTKPKFVCFDPSSPNFLIIERICETSNVLSFIPVKERDLLDTIGYISSGDGAMAFKSAKKLFLA